MTAPITIGLNLLISDKLDVERDALADVFAQGLRRRAAVGQIRFTAAWGRLPSG